MGPLLQLFPPCLLTTWQWKWEENASGPIPTPQVLWLWLIHKKKPIRAPFCPYVLPLPLLYCEPQPWCFVWQSSKIFKSREKCDIDHTHYNSHRETMSSASGNSNRVCHFKLVLLGDTAVGKSCLVVRFVRDEYFEYQEPTIGGETFALFHGTLFYVCGWRVCSSEILTNAILFFIIIITILAAFLTQTVALDDSTVKFEIWDTGMLFRPQK